MILILTVFYSFLLYADLYNLYNHACILSINTIFKVRKYCPFKTLINDSEPQKLCNVQCQMFRDFLFH